MIHKFLKYLKSQKIAYAIISGYESLFSDKVTTDDVDILFKKEHFITIETILKAFCKVEGYIIVQIYHQEVYAKNIFIFNPETKALLNLDIYGKLHRKQTVFFTEAHIFKTLSSYKGISILAPDQEYFHYLLKKIDKGNISNASFNYLQKLFIENEKSCRQVVEQYVKTLCRPIIFKAFKNNNKEILLKNIEALQTGVIKRNTSIVYKIKDQLRRFKRLVKPTGIAIAFLGPDGSGKSTIINGLTNKILPYRKTAYFHLKPIKNSSDHTNEVTTNPHEYEPYSKPKSYVKLLFFIYQYSLGWIKNIVPLKIRSTLVIFDRYYDDLIVDHRRYRYGGSKNIAKLIRVFLPKPELYFILTTDASIIYERKKEVALGELKRQVKDYTALADGKVYHNINVNNKPEAIVDEVYSILMKKMHERY